MNYNKLLQEVITEAKQINIPISDFIDSEVKINARAKSRFASCKRHILDGFQIEISSFMDQASIRDIK
jgi:hypothetical protein